MKLGFIKLFLEDSPMGAQDRRKELITSLWIALILAIIVLVIRPSAVGHYLLPALLMPPVLIGMHYRDRLSIIGRTALSSVTLAVVFLFSFRTVQTIHFLTTNPPVWDFQTFWLNGNVAIRQLNFYEPSNYHATAISLNLDADEEYTQEILDVGSFYPPMTMLLFVPLGWFDIQTAAFFWYLLQSIFLIADILLLWSLFLNKSRLNGLIFVSALVFMFPPIINNIWFAQINFILMFMILLFWRDRQIARGGVWMAIGIIIKPYVALLFIFVLIKRQWKLMISALITIAVLSLLSLIAFGPTTFFSYFGSNPASKLPEWYFAELGNGSLYAAIWRLIIYYLGEGGSGLIQPIFISVSMILVVVTSWLVYHLTPSHDEWALALILSLALFLYPNTGTNYCGVLMVPILLYWSHREKIPWGIWGFVVFATLETAFFGYHGGWSNFVIAGVALAWLTFLAIGLSLWLRKMQLT